MAKRISMKTQKTLDGAKMTLNKIIGSGFTIEGLVEMEDEQFDMYRSLAKSYKEFSELAISYSEVIDEQTNMLESIQRDMNKLLMKNE